MVFFQISMSIAHRKQECSSVKKLLTVCMRSHGLAAKGFDTLSTLGVTMGQRFSYEVVDQISKAEKMDVRAALRDPMRSVVTTHDNVDIYRRVFEQRKDNKSQLDNGTSAVAYICNEPSPDLEAFRVRCAEGRCITGEDIQQLAFKAGPVIRLQHIDYILKVLFDAAEFDYDQYEHRKSSCLQPPPTIMLLPLGRKDQPTQYVLESILQEEASYEGNMKVLKHVLRQYGFTDEDEYKRLAHGTILNWVGDQSTIFKMRMLPLFRAWEKNGFDRADYLNPLSGWLHHQITWSQSLHSEYFTDKSEHGLSSAFDLLERKGLRKPATKGTFFHTLEEALIHTAEARFRDLWLIVSGCNSLAELRSKSGEELRELAEIIYSKYASMAGVMSLEREDEDDQDQVLMQIVPFLRDFLDYIEFDRAISAGDVGRMRNMLPRMFFQFAGGRNPKYAIEILEMLQGLEHDWPDDLRYADYPNCQLRSKLSN
jgi:hypothetical protein